MGCTPSKDNTIQNPLQPASLFACGQNQLRLISKLRLAFLGTWDQNLQFGATRCEQKLIFVARLGRISLVSHCWCGGKTWKLQPGMEATCTWKPHACLTTSRSSHQSSSFCRQPKQLGQLLLAEAAWARLRQRRAMAVSVGKNDEPVELGRIDGNLPYLA